MKKSDFDRARTEANGDLLVLLAKYLSDNPHIRFGQALRSLDIVRGTVGTDGPEWVNEFNTEPTEMVERAKKVLKEI